MIRFERVSLRFAAGQQALRDISLTIAAGSFTFVTGHSGAGKSSLLRLLAALDRPTAGRIQVGEIDYSTLSAHQETALRQQMGIIFQDNQLLYDRHVFDNVALPLIIGGYRFRDIGTRVMAALTQVGLAERAFADPQVLSGGEQQRVGIARAVVARPRLLLADEPTGNLDADISDDIMRLLLRFHSSGVTVLLATHDQTLLDTWSLPRIALCNGELTASPETQTGHPGTDSAAYADSEVTPVGRPFSAP